MKLQDQVCTYQQGLRLKELGVKIQSYFTWMECLLSNDGDNFHEWWAVCRPNVGEYDFMTDDELPEGYENVDEWETKRECAAYTVAELGELLPDYLTVDSYRMHPRFYKQEQNNSPALWTATYGNSEDKDVPDFDFHNEAHCRAALLIWLIESNLTTIEQINK